ncbi:MAG TPA: pyruvate:ferredoxin (flavodoxin) oxidoreductase [Polyangiaceae bacterium]|nr:pyruvate:ferredoxin (flavodoxin) oxidoreductase [Polyangiaceae bacterium]
MVTVDANKAVADVAYRVSEVVAIYPITPASPMGEHADAWATRGRPNVWGDVPEVAELQAEGGAAGAIHGAVQAGALATTFTASQGLLLMIPNMYKIAGELTPCVIHVAARTVATHALSIFCDHSDVYAARGTGFAILGATNVQEAQDMALVSHAATLESRVPFLHFFDGFRTSHEIAKIAPVGDDVLRALIDPDQVAAHRARALSPDHPVVRGTAHNPDTYFQAREAINPFYDATPTIVQRTMDRLGELTGRHYHLVDYDGHPEAERVVIAMGSAAETVRETAKHLAAGDEKVGALTLRLYRPLPVQQLVEALPPSVRAIGVLDRQKEPGAPGEPLYLDVVASLAEMGRGDVLVTGGRYGLSSKEVTPAMIAAVFASLARDEPPRHFTVGITDDVTHSSLPVEPLQIEPAENTRAVFWGLGSDGTVSASKSSVEIIGERTELHAQGYFVYDSKKAGAVTVSHLRFGPEPIRAPYLVDEADFVSVSQWSFVDRYDVLEHATEGGTVLFNCPLPVEDLWDALPREAQDQIVERHLTVHAIDAYALAKELGLGRRINTIMQACFFALSGVLPREEAVEQIKQAIEDNYGKRGRTIVEINHRAVDEAVSHLRKVELPEAASSERRRPPVISTFAPDFVQRVTAMMIQRKGDLLPVSAFPPDGTWPTATAKWEKRNIALEIPVWDEELCIQCNKCALVCPHAAIRTKAYPDEASNGQAPPTFKKVPFRSKEIERHSYTVQVAPEDCTGCTLCVEVCPARDKSNPRHKAIDMAPQAPLRDAERDNFEHFLSLPELRRDRVRLDVKHTQLFQPLFEFSGACAGCGETPYIKLLTQLYGDRLLIANATGCSSIYGGNLPTTPYATDALGRGPAWSNSLFEDNAEFGLGMLLAVDRQKAQARRLLGALTREVGGGLVRAILEAEQVDEAGIAEQRERVDQLKRKLADLDGESAARLRTLADYLVDKSIWIVGGDGWAYDIGYGGLDHVLASGRNVNVLVLDTEVYSNTGGQQSKATPLGAAAKFAAAGRELPKKNLGMLAMAYGNVYVAQVAMGASDKQTLQAFTEATAHPGPSLIIAYSHCIAHGYDLSKGLEQQSLAAQTGYWPLYRFDPRRLAEDKPALVLDSKPPKKKVAEFAYNETRFRLLLASDPARAETLMNAAQADAERRFALYQQLAGKS